MTPEPSRLTWRCSASNLSVMDSGVPRLGFSLDALIAEAKRRARQRRLLVALLLVVVAGVTAALVLGPSGGGLRVDRLSARAGGTSSPRSVHFGGFVLTVPKGFRLVETRQSRTSHALYSVTVADDSRTARAVTYSVRPPPANGVALFVDNFGSSAPPGSAPRLPLDLHKLHRLPDKIRGDVTRWSAFLSGGGGAWQVTVFEGSKASAADRAAIEGALRSIRRAR